MKSILIAAVSFILCADFCYAQKVNSYQVKEVDQPLTDPRAIPGCRVLWKEEQALQKYVQQHPEVLAAAKTAQPTAWNFHVNDTKTWWATNLATNAEYSVPSTCRKVGVHAYYFVADSLWNTKVTQTQVDSIAAAFDFRTPASPTKGIYQTDVETFGSPPNVDQDSLIIILILDIQDGLTGTGSFIAGYFFSINEYPDGSPAIGSHRSNHAEIYYVDGVQDNLSTPTGLATAIETTGHEFQHMIHWNYDPNEITFINEGCSMVAEVVCGFPVSFQSSYVSNTNVYLLHWDNGNAIPDYARAQRWLLYLWNQFPNGYLKLLVQNTGTGITGIDGALAQYGTPRRFADVFKDWLVANVLDDASVNSQYAYTYSGTLAKPVGTKYLNPNTGMVAGSVTHLGADYITFTSGSNLSITFTSGSSAVQVKAIEIGPAGKKVSDVLPNQSFSEQAFGTGYTNVMFLVLNSSQTTDASYSYQATGTSITTVELKYDYTEPTSYLGNAAGDTVSVWFDAVPGAKLDSIRVALRRAGSMIGGVWRYTGSLRPSPLGAPLAVGLTATVTATPTVPYPVPWPNWATIDLRGYNLLTDHPFAVAFRCEGVYSSSPRVMVTQVPTPSTITSYTYSTTATGGPNWYYYTSNAASDSVHIYLIRAYVSFPATDVQGGIELQPASFSLRQNYPNPFNPSTWIEYQLPSTQPVLVAVYDLLGRRVRTIVDDSNIGVPTEFSGMAKTMQAGKLQVEFTSISSGRRASSRRTRWFS